MNNIPELSLEPVEPKVIGRCIMCGDEIYENEFHFCVDEGMVHDDNICFFQYLEECCSAEEVATAMHIPLKIGFEVRT